MKKLESTRKILENSVLRVHRKGFGYSKITIIENNDYYLAAIANEDFFHSITGQDVVEAYLWVEDVASYEFEMKVIGVLTSGTPIIFFQHTSHITRSEERKCLTAEADVPVKFFTFDPADRSKSVSTEEIVSHTGTVILLSDREATMRSDLNLGGARFLKGEIMINDNAIELVGMIDIINDAKNIYNILFVGMHEKVRNQLLEYIFSIYRE